MSMLTFGVAQNADQKHTIDIEIVEICDYFLMNEFENNPFSVVTIIW